MHSLNSQTGEFSIDLTEAYLHVPIHPDYRKYLRFHYHRGHYQYSALPFSLSSALRVFTKIMAALVAHIRSLSIRILFYLDDILIQSSSLQAAHQVLATTIQVLESWLLHKLGQKPLNSFHQSTTFRGGH